MEREEGCGIESIKREGLDYAEARKQTPGRWRLRLVLLEHGEVKGSSYELVKDHSETTAPLGRASVAIPFCC